MATQFSQNIIVKALEAKCRLRKLDANHYLVTPPPDPNDCTNSKGAYLLAYTIDKNGAPTIESCRDAETREQCKGFRFNRGECYHGATVAMHVLKPILTVKVRRVVPGRRKASH